MAFEIKNRGQLYLELTKEIVAFQIKQGMISENDRARVEKTTLVNSYECYKEESIATLNNRLNMYRRLNVKKDNE